MARYFLKQIAAGPSLDQLLNAWNSDDKMSQVIFYIRHTDESFAVKVEEIKPIDKEKARWLIKGHDEGEVFGVKKLFIKYSTLHHTGTVEPCL